MTTVRRAFTDLPEGQAHSRDAGLNTSKQSAVVDQLDERAFGRANRARHPAVVQRAFAPRGRGDPVDLEPMEIGMPQRTDRHTRRQRAGMRRARRGTGGILIEFEHDAPAADFRVDGAGVHGVPGLINLFGIESPGLTSALAIGEHVAALLEVK